MKTQMVQVIYTGDATVVGARNGHAESGDGRLKVELSAPKSLGGTDTGTGTNPEQLFAAAHAACFGGALEYQAKQRGIETGPFSIRSEVGVGPSVGGAFGITQKLTVSMPEMEQADADALVGAADKACPYSNAIRGNVEVEIVVQGRK